MFFFQERVAASIHNISTTLRYISLTIISGFHRIHGVQEIRGIHRGKIYRVFEQQKTVEKSAITY